MTDTTTEGTGLTLETRSTAVYFPDAKRAGVEVAQEVRPHVYGHLEVTNIWKVTPLSDDWVAATRFVAQAGVLVVGEIRIYPREPRGPLGEWPPGEWSGTLTGYRATVPAGGLTTTMARRGTTLAARLREAQQDVEWSRSEVALARQQGRTRRHDPFSDKGVWGRVGIADPDALAPTPGWRMAGLVRQARAAHIYVQALEAGKRGTVQAVAARLRVPYSQALSIIHLARVNDLLLPKVAKQGRPEGRLTPRAKALLNLTAPNRKARTERKLR